MAAADLPEADRIFRNAFATFLGVDPQTFMSGSRDRPQSVRHGPERRDRRAGRHAVVGSNFVAELGLIRILWAADR